MHARKCYTLNKQKVKLDFIIFIFCSAKERNSDKFEIFLNFFFFGWTIPYCVKLKHIWLFLVVTWLNYCVKRTSKSVFSVLYLSVYHQKYYYKCTVPMVLNCHYKWKTVSFKSSLTSPVLPECHKELLAELYYRPLLLFDLPHGKSLRSCEVIVHSLSLAFFPQMLLNSLSIQLFLPSRKLFHF